MKRIISLALIITLISSVFVLFQFVRNSIVELINATKQTLRILFRFLFIDFFLQIYVFLLNKKIRWFTAD